MLTSERNWTQGRNFADAVGSEKELNPVWERVRGSATVLGFVGCAMRRCLEAGRMQWTPARHDPCKTIVCKKISGLIHSISKKYL